MANAVLKDLLSLSKMHLRFVMEEDWDSWEGVIHKKRGLYRELARCQGMLIPAQEKDLFSEIQKLESETKEALLKKRTETEQELSVIRRGKKAFKGYGDVGRKHSGAHFGIKC